jgi:glyoxylase-like metal-dependent hydrolase (beta-lactamase superfamily II)
MPHADGMQARPTSRNILGALAYQRKASSTLADLSLHVGTVVSPPFYENTYIAYINGRRDCVVFDPGLEPQPIIEYLAENSLTPAAILCTHGHSDHIAGNRALKNRWPQCPILIGAGDAEKLVDANLNLSAPFGFPITSPPADRTVQEGDQVSAAGLELAVYEAPGHSVGHVVFLTKQFKPWRIFGGDVLFQGSIGRTDFPDGSFEALRWAIHNKLFTLPDDTIVYSGHGPETTIGHEKRTNPFVGSPAAYVE